MRPKDVDRIANNVDLDQKFEFLNSHELLHKNQSGVPPKHSCETALIYMIDSWLKAINDDDDIVG